LRKALPVAAGLAAFLATVALIYFVVVQYLSQPLGRLYRTLAQLAELAPQDWIWATMIALTVLFALRNFASRRESAGVAEPIDGFQTESLESWLQLLQDRARGTYFRWRLANRLAELDSQIPDHPEQRPDQQVQEYLKMGRDRRTIEDTASRFSGSYPVDGVVTYLEQRIEADYGS